MTDDEPLKQVLVIRHDLSLSAGKAAAQASHASLWAANRAPEHQRTVWEEEYATKVVLGVESEEELRGVAEDARNAELPTSVVNDAGRTEVEEGTTTALGIGPAPESEIDAVTGHLGLYK